MTDPGMKCSRCKSPARFRFPQHNARFCGPCLDVFFTRQVEKAIKKFAMLAPGQPVLVAVSGGKDSLALWRVLCELGYPAEGVHLLLELGPFSGVSQQASQAMADRLGRPLHTRRLADLAGCTVQEAVWANKREFCSVCGALKRYYLNRIAAELGFAAIATGHHLDDETGRMLGNLIHGRAEHLKRTWPVLEGSEDGFVKKIKPLCRLDGDEIRAYASLHDLPVAQGACTGARGATLPFYQEAMALLEQRMPGTKRDLYLGFLRRQGAPPPAPAPGAACRVCGQPTYVETCTVCRLLERTRQWRAQRARTAAPDQPRS
ncbi:MAG: ATP-binding protein [Thermodesulfobacteriota bacterium]